MNNRVKNFCILAVLIAFLLIVYAIPVTCIFKQVIGISCPSCGMTRAFLSILHFDFYNAFTYNILSIPLFIFIIYSILRLIIDNINSQFKYVPKLLNSLTDKKFLIIIFILLFISFIFNNLK